MNAIELETIAAQLAALRRPAAPPNHGPAPRSLRTGNRAPSPNEAGNPKRFNPQIAGPNTNIQPWGPRPRIASVRGKRAQSIAKIDRSPTLWTIAFLVLGAGFVSVAVELLEVVRGPVVVHLVWPV